MTSTEKLILTTTVKKINDYLEKGYDKYVIADYIESIILLVRTKYSDELLRALFNLRHQFLLGKEVNNEKS